MFQKEYNPSQTHFHPFTFEEIVDIAADPNIKIVGRSSTFIGDKTLEEHKEHAKVHILPARHPFYGAWDERGRKVHFVGRYENLQEDFAIVAKQVGFTGQLLHRNKSEDRTHYSDYYTSELRDKVGDIFADDIKLFNYSFHLYKTSVHPVKWFLPIKYQHLQYH